MRALTCLLAGALLVASCGGVAPRHEVLSDVAEQVLLPAVESMADAAASLSEDVAGLCATPSAGTLDGARESWLAASRAWGVSQAAAFGPVMDLRLESTIRYAVDPAKVLELAKASPTADDLAGAGADVRGLDAVGVLVNGDGSDELTTTAGSGRCEYAAAVAAQVAGAADTVAGEWRGGFVADLGAEAGAQMRLEDVYNAMTSAVEEADRALASVIDGKPGVSPVAIVPLVSGAAAVYQPSGEGGRLADLVPDGGVAADLSDRFDTALSALAGVGADSDPDTLRDAYVDLGEVLLGLQSSLAGQLGVTLMLSDADGDA